MSKLFTYVVQAAVDDRFEPIMKESEWATQLLKPPNIPEQALVIVFKHPPPIVEVWPVILLPHPPPIKLQFAEAVFKVPPTIEE